MLTVFYTKVCVYVLVHVIPKCQCDCSLNSGVFQGCLFLHPVCGGKDLVLFMLSQCGPWPTNKGQPVVEKNLSPQHC